MNLDRIRSLIAQIEAAGEDFETSPAEDETINELETQIGHRLPASYFTRKLIGNWLTTDLGRWKHDLFG